MNLLLADSRLYTFIDTAYLAGRSPETLASLLCEGGSDLIQLRAKNASIQETERLARRILPITQSANVGLVINDHPAIASAVGAPFCHMGQEDFFDAGFSQVSDLWKMLPPASPGRSPVRIGLSTHAPAQAERARAAGADYVAIGPVFPTPTKPTACPVTLDYVRWAATHLTVPWFAIGGITLENVDSVLEAGARRICVVSAILSSSDPVRTCQKFRERLLSAACDAKR